MKQKVLGTVQLGVPYGINNGVMPSRDYSLRLLENAYDQGIRYLDTARAYGESLEVIGDYHSKKLDKKFKVFSKFMLKDLKESSQKLVEEQCRIMNVSNIQGIYFHKFDEYQTSEKIIQNFKESDKLESVGVSLYNTEEFLKASVDTSIDILQLPMSIFHHKSSLRKKLLESDTKQKIYLRSIYLQGLIFLPEDKLTGKLEAFIPVVRFLRNASTELLISPEQLAASYAVDCDKVEGILFGAEKIEQVESNNRMLKTSKIDWENLLKDMPKVDDSLLNPGNWK